MKERFKWLLSKSWFSNALAGCIIVVFYLIVSNLAGMQLWFSNMIGYFSTVIYGCILAYIMDPLTGVLERSVFRWIRSKNIKRYLSVFVTVIVVVAAFALIMIVLIPQLVDSLKMFVTNIDSYADTLRSFIKGRLKLDTADDLPLRSDAIIGEIVSYFSNNFMNIINMSTNTGKQILSWAIAFILSIYLLLERDRMKSGVKRLLHALLKDSAYQYTVSSVSYCNKVMSKYVSLSIIDGIIVGLATFIFMLIFDMPYVGLIAVVVGITNLVPTFGPIVGGAIGGFILLMVQPMQAITFIVFVIVLQIIDGYVLKPRLFGSSFGISGLWILVFILVGSNVFGIAGVLLAIPCATIFDTVYHEVLLKHLESRKYDDSQE